MSENKKEMVNHPDHYQGRRFRRFEVIDVIEDYNLGFNLGNAIKYILRCEKKHAKTQDLKKAIWYIEREIKNSENKCPVCGKYLENENMQVCKECEKDIQWGASISEYAEKNKNCCIKKCFSCGKEFCSNDARDLICPKCYDKYVDDCKNDLTKIKIEPIEVSVCVLCGYETGNANLICPNCCKIHNVNEQIKSGKSLEEILENCDNLYWHDYKKEKPQKGEYFTRFLVSDILSKRIEVKSNWLGYDENGEHLSKANIIKIISWREEMVSAEKIKASLDNLYNYPCLSEEQLK